MTQAVNTSQQQTTILLCAPLIFIPFCALFFWALGGGKGNPDNPEAAAAKGLNSFLPSPQLKDKGDDKLALYRQEDKDSAAAASKRPRSMSLFDKENLLDFSAPDSSDQGYDPTEGRDGAVSEPFSLRRGRSAEPTGHSGRRRSKEPVDELEAKLAALQSALKEAPDQDREQLLQRREANADRGSSSSQALEQLQSTVEAINRSTTSTAADPELGQMAGIMDKILDVQHPERVRERMAEQGNKKGKSNLQVAPTTSRPLVDVSLGAEGMDSTAIAVRTRPLTVDGFFELSTVSQANANVAPSIEAVVHETQTMVSGAAIKVRLQQDIYLHDQLIPQGTFIFGMCSLSGERLQIEFTTIRYGQRIFPVSLTAYSLDGLPGIRIPGSITREEAKKGSDQAIQSIGLATLDPSLAAQATSAGLDVAKKLLGRKVKLIRVTIKSDYPILLRDGASNR